MSGFNAVLARNTENAPQNIGPYSQTVAFSHYNNLAAQLPIDPETGKLVEGGIEEQAAQCFNNIEAVIESIGHAGRIVHHLEAREAPPQRARRAPRRPGAGPAAR